jgi:tRNA (guanine-N7-)-methyltransferase
MAHRLKDYPSVSLLPEQVQGKLNFSTLFGRCAPVHLEIGSGKGTFLVNEAQAATDTDFLGIEWASKYYRYAVDRIGRWELTNVRLIRTDAAVFLRDHVDDHTADCFHIYYPDPWPKKRHNKRRFICKDNMDQILRILKTGGHLRIVTDHADYYEHMDEVLRDYSHRFRPLTFRPTAGAKTGERVGTNFERKYLKEERLAFSIALEKTS